MLNQYNDGGGWRYPVWLTPTVQAGVWYTVSILVDDVRGQTIDVYTSTNRVHYSYNIYFGKGKDFVRCCDKVGEARAHRVPIDAGDQCWTRVDSGRLGETGLGIGGQLRRPRLQRRVPPTF